MNAVRSSFNTTPAHAHACAIFLRRLQLFRHFIITLLTAVATASQSLSSRTMKAKYEFFGAFRIRSCAALISFWMSSGNVASTSSRSPTSTNRLFFAAVAVAVAVAASGRSRGRRRRRRRGLVVARVAVVVAAAAAVRGRGRRGRWRCRRRSSLGRDFIVAAVVEKL